MTQTPAALPFDAPQAQALRRQHRRLATAVAASGQAPWLHDEVARRLADKLDAILLQPQQWLDWSGAVGGDAQAVASRYAQALRWVHEADATLAQRALAHWQSTQAQPWWAAWKALRKQAPAPIITSPQAMPPTWPEEGVDMLWANMSLHTRADLGAMLGQWLGWLKTGGFVMCSGLGPDTGLELRRLYADLGWGLPTVRFMDMHDLGDALVEAGFKDPVMDMERITLTWSDPQAMLAELRAWGGNVALGRMAGCRTPAWRDRLLAALQAHCARPDGRLGLTIEVVYGHAIKPEPRVKMAPESTVSLAQMRRMVRGR
jgi:malonyl-CoA O-methyltransferase